MTRGDAPEQAPRPIAPDAHQLTGYPGRWTVWICRLAAVGVWLVFAVGGLFLWALSYAGPNNHDDRGMPLGPSQAEEITVLALLVVLLVLMLAAVEVPLRSSLRSMVRWFGLLGLAIAVLLYLSMETWNPTANVTAVGTAIAVGGGLLGGFALLLVTRRLDGMPRWRPEPRRRCF